MALWPTTAANLHDAIERKVGDLILRVLMHFNVLMWCLNVLQILTALATGIEVVGMTISKTVELCKMLICFKHVLHVF